MKTALVTGSSRGIGRAIALELAKNGYRVWIHAANRLEKAEEVKRLIEENGGVADVLIGDMTDLDCTKKMTETVGNIDVLVLNASLQYRTPWDQIGVDACMDQLHCNFVSSLIWTQAVVPHMKEQGWGRIITIGSVQERKPHPDMLVYSASKAAQTHLVHSLSPQLAPFGITVNNVAPGVIYTDRNVKALSDPVYAKQVTDSIPMGYYGKPDDCAGIVRFLCTDEARYITGQNIFVDGGKGIC